MAKYFDIFAFIELLAMEDEQRLMSMFPHLIIYEAHVTVLTNLMTGKVIPNLESISLILVINSWD